MKNSVSGSRHVIGRKSFSDFFSIARFGPDTLAIFGLLSGLATVLYHFDLWYLTGAVLATLFVLFLVEAVETITLSRAEYRKIVGAKCLVIKEATRENRGIVRLFGSDGNLVRETWSTEFSQAPVPEGSLAKVTGMRSVILEISADN